MVENLLYLVYFGLLTVIQSIIINGVHISFQGYDEEKEGKIILHGNIFYPIKRWVEIKGKENKFIIWVGKPICTCIKCMASVWGAATFFPIVINVFGFHWQEIGVFVLDVFALVYLNYFFYKKV